MNLNKAHLIGRMTKDPELRSLPSGSAVVTFSLATNHTYTDKAGNKQENTSFHNCSLFGKGAEVFAKYAVKGQEIYASGRIEYQEWEKKDGTKAQKTVILVDEFQFGQKPKGSEYRSSDTEEVQMEFKDEKGKVAGTNIDDLF